MRPLLLLVALTLAACAPVVTEKVVYVDAPPAPAAEPIPEAPLPPEEPAAPVWVPEPWHIYLLDTEAVLVDEEARPESAYRTRYTCWSLTAESHNAESPADPWRVVGGGMQ